MIASVSMGISSASAFAASRSTGMANTSFEATAVTAEKDTANVPLTDPAESLRWMTRLYEGTQRTLEAIQKYSDDTTVIDYYSQSVSDLTEQLRTATGSARAQISSDLQAAREGLAQAKESKAAAQNSFAEHSKRMEPFLTRLAENIGRFTAQIEAAGATPTMDATL